jgi:DNA-binding NtrC family response regulator
MANNTFREDLYYRLNVITIKLPALRERPDDIPTLVDHFVRKYCLETGRRIEGISPEAIDLLKRYPWRGNIRELENCIERSVILANDVLIRPQDLLLSGCNQPVPVAAPAASESTVGLSLKDIERRHIIATLESCSGNQSKAASILGIDRKTLRTKVKDYGLAGSDAEDEN